MPFSDSIIGHSEQCQALAEDMAEDNVSHAYLFAGPRHVGKMTLAKQFANQLILAGVDKDAKDITNKQLNKLIHPDLFVLDQLWIEGVEQDWEVIAKTSNVPQQHRSKAPKAKTDTIGIDDIRALQERLHEKSTSSFRCCLIRSSERMQSEAVNAFLKILEEPPPRVVFILTTQSISALLPTLVSRCRLVRFNRVPTGQLKEMLEGKSEDETQFILKVARGAPGMVKQLIGNPEALRNHRLAHEKARSFWSSSSGLEKLKLLEPLFKRGRDSDRMLLHLMLALRDQKPEEIERFSIPLRQLIAGLNTNAHRQLISQQFALEVG